jgi:hypothetical protein
MRNDPQVIHLVTRARNGEQPAWGAVVERYSPLVWSICRRWQLNRTVAVGSIGPIAVAAQTGCGVTGNRRPDRRLGRVSWVWRGPMTAILNGSLRAEIVSDAGARIKRLSLRQATARSIPTQPACAAKTPGCLAESGRYLTLSRP